MSSINVTEARANLPQLLDRVEQGEEITITRHGRPAAVLVRHDALRSRRAEKLIERSQRVRALFEEVRHLRLSDTEPLDPARAEEMIAEIRRDRDAGH